MELDFQFFFRSILLGFGLAMDAFSVSVANGLNEPKMKFPKMCGTAGIFAFFQFLMPMIGWLCVCLIASLFGFFEKLIPWIALVLLCFIGIKMIIDKGAFFSHIIQALRAFRRRSLSPCRLHAKLWSPPLSPLSRRRPF